MSRHRRKRQYRKRTALRAAWFYFARELARMWNAPDPWIDKAITRWDGTPYVKPVYTAGGLMREYDFVDLYQMYREALLARNLRDPEFRRRLEETMREMFESVTPADGFYLGKRSSENLGFKMVGRIGE